MKLSDVKRLVARGEGKTIEFKRSTGEMKQGLETICAFSNTDGGTLLFGVASTGHVEGQQVSDQTLHEISAALDRFEPRPSLEIDRVGVGRGRAVIALRAQANRETVPFTFDGRAFERVGNTTRRMSQQRYETLLLARAHARRRWENQAAVGVDVRDLDREEILRTRELAILGRRITAETGRRKEEILDRMGLRRDRVLTQAALVLYGKRFLPDYPQCLLKMGRFRGSEVTGDILDNRQERMHAFAMLREGMAFLDRTLPLAARFPEGEILREDRLPVPPAALREVLLNAIIHRDYSDPGGCVSIAVFDDRIEIRSTGRLPADITAEMLYGPHLSRPRNPLIAEAFHRVGAVEVWGRGTNRVIEECVEHGLERPAFEERDGTVVVTFRARIGESRPGAGGRNRRLGTKPDTKLGTKLGNGSPREDRLRLVLELASSPRSIHELMAGCGRSDRTKFRLAVLRPLIEQGLLVMTIPDRPRSTSQRYSTTAKGTRLLGTPSDGAGNP